MLENTDEEPIDAEAISNHSHEVAVSSSGDGESSEALHDEDMDSQAGSVCGDSPLLRETKREEEDEEEEGDERGRAKNDEQGEEIQRLAEDVELNHQEQPQTPSIGPKLRANRNFNTRSSNLDAGASMLANSAQSSNQTKSYPNSNNNNNKVASTDSMSNNNNNSYSSHKQSPKLVDSQQMHVCRLCDKLLSSSSSLDRHMLTHSGERPFVCKRCHMTFTTNGNMHRHMRTHLHKDSLARQQQEQRLKSLVSGSSVANSVSSNKHQNAAVTSQIGPASLVAYSAAVAQQMSGSLESASCHQPAAAFGGGQQNRNPEVNSVTALLNQQLVAALKQQQHNQQTLTRARRGPLPASEDLSSGAISSATGGAGAAQAVTAMGNLSGAQTHQQRLSQAQQHYPTTDLLAQNISSTSPSSVDHLQPNLPSSLASPASLIPHAAIVTDGQSVAAKFLRQSQQFASVDPKSLMLGALQGDQLGLESVKAVMLAAAAAAAAAAVSQQQQQQHPFPQHSGPGCELTDTPPLVGDVEDGTAQEQDESPSSILQRVVRSKRRKQVNPRSTRAPHQANASLNSDDSDEDRRSSERETPQMSGHKRSSAYNSERFLADDSVSGGCSTPPLHRSFERAAKAQQSISSSLQSKYSDFDDNNNDTDEDDDETNNNHGGSLIVANKRQSSASQQDFNNNQGEEENIEREFGEKKEWKNNVVERDEEGQQDADENNGSGLGNEMDCEEGRIGGPNVSNYTSDDEDDESLDSLDVNMNLSSENNNSSYQMPTTPSLIESSSQKTTANSDYLAPSSAISLDQDSQQQSLANNFHRQQSATNTTTKQQQQQPQQHLPNPLATVNGEIIEDISQSYVKTANPNAARKGGKRNRHCYKCKLCTYSSVDRCTLVRHLRIHSGERPYICGICRYAFTTKANCERHVRKRHKKQYNSLGGAGGGGVKGSNGGGRSLIITDHSNHQTIPVKVNPVAAQTISQTLQRIQEKQQQGPTEANDHSHETNISTHNPHNNNIQHQQHPNDMLVDIQHNGTTSSPSKGGYKGNKRKHRGDIEPTIDSVPYQRSRLADKQEHDLFGVMRMAKNLNSTNHSNRNQNILFNPQASSFATPNSDLSSTNELFVNLMAQLQQVSSQQHEPKNKSSNHGNANQMIAQAPSSQVTSATVLANMLAAGKGLQAGDSSSPLLQPPSTQPPKAFGSSQRSLLSPKNLSQQIAQLRNLQNSQNPLFIRRNPFDPFNPLDLAAQALDLSCKFQSSK